MVRRVRGAPGLADGDLAARALEAPALAGVPGRDPPALARRGLAADMRAVCGAIPREIANIYDSGTRCGGTAACMPAPSASSSPATAAARCRPWSSPALHTRAAALVTRYAARRAGQPWYTAKTAPPSRTCSPRCAAS